MCKDVVAAFTFGNKRHDYSPARFIDLGSDVRDKSNYDVAFHGTVRLTFTGEPLPDDLRPEPTDPEDDDRIDIAPFFKNLHLGRVFGGKGKPKGIV